MDDVTIILQGRINPACLERWITTYFDWNVVVSTWTKVDGHNNKINISSIPSKWSVLSLPQPQKTIDIGTLQFQIQSTTNAFPHVNSEYLIKVRGDEFYSNLHRFVREMKYKKEQIICSDIYYRGFQKSYFHISDHLIGGTTNNVKAMFENTFKQISDGWKMTSNFDGSSNPETYLGFGFVSYKEKILKENHEHYLSQEISEPLFEKWFDNYDLQKLSPYLVSCQRNSFDVKYNCTPNF